MDDQHPFFALPGSSVNKMPAASPGPAGPWMCAAVSPPRSEVLAKQSCLPSKVRNATPNELLALGGVSCPPFSNAMKVFVAATAGWAPTQMSAMEVTRAKVFASRMVLFMSAPRFVEWSRRILPTMPAVNAPPVRALPARRSRFPETPGRHGDEGSSGARLEGFPKVARTDREAWT